MSSGPGRGALIGGLVVVLAIAVGVWLMTSERTQPEAAHDGKPTQAEATPDKPAFTASDGDKSAAPLTPDTTPMKPGAVTPGAVEPEEMPLVAQGHVSWPAGKLPPGTDVSLYDSEGLELDSQSAADDGSYELRWDEPLLPGWSVGTESLSVKFNGKNVDLAPDNVGPLPLHLPGEPPVKADLVLGMPPTLVGTVHDRLTGTALAGATVSVGSISLPWAQGGDSAMTDEQGNYSLPIGELPLHGLLVWATADEHQAQLVGPQDVAPALQPDGTFRLDFALDAAAPWHGHVISAATGQPVDGATITIGSDYVSLADVTDFEVTDENGEFSLESPDMPATGAWLHVYVDDESYGPAVLRDIAPGQDIMVRLGGPLTLEGTVSFGKDKPVPLADITVYFDGEPVDGASGLSDTARTDSAGAFSVALQYSPLANAKVRVEAMGAATWEARLQDVAKPGPGGDLKLDVTLVGGP
jgi:hypothetical protein